MSGLGRVSRRRRYAGTSFIEVAFSAIVISIMVLFTLDIGILLMAYSITDRACRDACRAAAQGAGTNESAQLINATARADAALAQYKSPGGGLVISGPERDTSVDTDGVFWQNPQGGTNNFVRVTTKSTIKVPVPVLLGGIDMGKDGVVVRKQYTFPITGMVNF
jgi:Flp pilus assembly protein TadG